MSKKDQSRNQEISIDFPMFETKYKKTRHVENSKMVKIEKAVNEIKNVNDLDDNKSIVEIHGNPLHLKFKVNRHKSYDNEIDESSTLKKQNPILSNNEFKYLSPPLGNIPYNFAFKPPIETVFKSDDINS